MFTTKSERKQSECITKIKYNHWVNKLFKNPNSKCELKLNIKLISLHFILYSNIAGVLIPGNYIIVCVLMYVYVYVNVYTYICMPIQTLIGIKGAKEVIHLIGIESHLLHQIIWNIIYYRFGLKP